MRYDMQFYESLKIGDEIWYIRQWGVCCSPIEKISIRIDKTDKICENIFLNLSSGELISGDDYACLSRKELREELFP